MPARFAARRSAPLCLLVAFAIQLAMIERACRVCGAQFKTYVAWLRGGRAGFFCSQGCQRKGCRRKPPTLLKGRCMNCQREFQRRANRAGKMQFCSIQCMAGARGRAMAGANHPNWKGGISTRPHAVRAAIERQKKKHTSCRMCGKRGPLHGHHVRPLADDATLGASENNIVVLCVECHAAQHPRQAGFLRSHQRPA